MYFAKTSFSTEKYLTVIKNKNKRQANPNFLKDKETESFKSFSASCLSSTELYSKPLYSSFESCSFSSSRISSSFVVLYLNIDEKKLETAFFLFEFLFISEDSLSISSFSS
ncbi:MAG: type IV secretory system conjugative DNA transfer family protein [Clostridia bacterium]|nr:type IV secretory system conjugative DNA transfer family protein [Clostridia bacterium]